MKTLFTFFLIAATACANAQTFSATPNLAIPDNNTSGVTSIIEVSGVSPATVADGILTNVSVNVTHGNVSDVMIFLSAPNGLQLTLSNQNGNDGNDYSNTIFTMTADTSITLGTPPYAGSYIPEESFSSFNGSDVNGDWMLIVIDNAANNVGMLKNWSITFNGPTTINNLVKQSLQVTPTFAHDKIFVASSHNNESIIIYNVTGQLIAEERLGKNGFVDVSSLPKGMYMIKSINSSATAKFIKN